MTGWPILSTITFLPLVGVLLMSFISDYDEAGRRNIRWIALFTTVLGASNPATDLIVELVHIDADAACYRVSVPGRDTRSASDLRVLLVSALAREQIALGRASSQPPALQKAVHG